MSSIEKGKTYEQCFGYVEACRRKKFLSDSPGNGGLLRKMNKARTGRSYSDIYGVEKGREVAKRISESLFGFRKYDEIKPKKCIVCGKIFYKKYFESYKYFRRKKICDVKCLGLFKKGKFLEEIVGKREAKRLIENSSGKNSTSYKNGNNKYSNTKRTRKLIMERDKGICQLCFKKIFNDEKIEGKIMNCHHIHYNSRDKRLKTIVLLHHSCHSRTRANRDYWFEYFCKLKNTEPSEVLR